MPFTSTLVKYFVGKAEPTRPELSPLWDSALIVGY
jgi:hypothetical protein